MASSFDVFSLKKVVRKRERLSLHAMCQPFLPSLCEIPVKTCCFSGLGACLYVGLPEYIHTQEDTNTTTQTLVSVSYYLFPLTFTHFHLSKTEKCNQVERKRYSFAWWCMSCVHTQDDEIELILRFIIIQISRLTSGLWVLSVCGERWTSVGEKENREPTIQILIISYSSHLISFQVFWSESPDACKLTHLSWCVRHWERKGEG